MLNLNTTYPIKHDGAGLTVVVDLNWLGKITTAPNRDVDIIPSRAALLEAIQPIESDDSLCI